MRALVVMGVAASGKSTVAAMLAERLGWAMIEGDALHPAQNRAKMASGVPLDDADREPWLDAIRLELDRLLAAGQGAVVACSALKRAYRARLGLPRPEVRLVALGGDRSLLARRIADRLEEGRHFMPPSLLDSQLATLEPPADDERPIRVDVADSPGAIAERVLAELGPGTLGIS